MDREDLLVIDFDGDLTHTERQQIIDAVLTLEARADGTAYTTAHMDTLKDLLTRIARLLINDTQFPAERRQGRRFLPLDGSKPPFAEYRHELLMNVDEEYRHAWLYDHSEEYRETADAEPHNMKRVLAGRVEHPYRENDPEIVDRSLLRHFMRPLREGETYPPAVLGKYAPEEVVMLDSIVRQRVQPELSITVVPLP